MHALAHVGVAVLQAQSVSYTSERELDADRPPSEGLGAPHGTLTTNNDSVRLYYGKGRLEVPSHSAKIWVEDEVIRLQFPEIRNIALGDGSNAYIREHVIKFPATETGITAAEATVYVRQLMLAEESKELLLAFARVGHNLSEIMALYRKLLG